MAEVIHGIDEIRVVPKEELLLAVMTLKNENRRLTALHIEPPVERTTALAYRNKRTLSVAARRFIDFVIDYFGAGK